MLSRRRTTACAFGAIAVACAVVSLNAVPPAEAGSVESNLHEAILHVEDGLDANGVPGASLAVVAPDHTVAVESFGTGRGDEPVTDQTPFLIGSVTKSFTALSVMQLSGRGQIALDAPVNRYLPWFGDIEALTGQITVRMLLNQTSGIPADAGGDGLRYLDDKSIRDTAKELRGPDLSAQPGAEFEYANGNYVLLGAVLEAASGEPYAEYVQTHIFDPLGMSHSYVSLDEARAHGMSDGHRYWFGSTAAHTTFTEGLVPAGGVISTAPDMARYTRMYLGKGALGRTRLISRSGFAELTRPVAEAEVGPWAKDPDVAYAMGLYRGGAPFGNEDAIFHPGGSPDFGSMMIVFPESRVGLVLLYNVSPEVDLPGANGAVDRIPASAASILIGEEPAEGWSMHKFYLVFDAVVLLLLAACLWALARAVRGHPRSTCTTVTKALRLSRMALALLAGTLLLTFPLLTGVGWSVLFLSIPDLALVEAVIGALLLAIGVVRLLHLLGLWSPAETGSG